MEWFKNIKIYYQMAQNNYIHRLKQNTRNALRFILINDNNASLARNNICLQGIHFLGKHGQPLKEPYVEI